MSMNRKDLLKHLGKLQCEILPDQIPTPHKPLLVLWALKRIEDRHPERLASFKGEIEPPMKKLLKRFNYSDYINAARPFWHLQNDEIWETSEVDPAAMGAREYPRQEYFRSAQGGFEESVYDLLCSNPGLLAEAIHTVIEGHFPRPLREHIRKAFGFREYDVSESGVLAVHDEELPPIVLNREFKLEVLGAYEERCAICDHDIRLEGAPLDLMATHIRSHESGGPDEVPNGLALCGSHDTAFKSGAISLDSKGGDFVVLVSDQLGGQGITYEMLRLLRGHPLRSPLEKDQVPNPAFVKWHRQQVFRGAPLQ